MLDIMNIPSEDFEDMVGDTDRLIMSDGLEVDFGDVQQDIQKLILDSSDINFVCNLVSASSTFSQDISNRVWKLEIEAPGLSFGDLLGVTKITFNFNEKMFESTETFAWAITEMGSVITFNAKRIFNNNE
jgi:hypothetical protein